MMEETKTEEEPKKELDIVAKAKEEREKLDKANEEAARLLAELKEARTEQILSGKSDVSRPEEKKAPTDEEYLKAAQSGKILE